MSKELEALKKIKQARYFVDFELDAKVSEDYKKEIDIIENALKRLAVYETFNLLDDKDDVDKLTDIKGKLTYVDKVMDTQERLLASVSADEIRILSSVLNSQIKTLKKKIKALEIIKEKRVDTWLIIQGKVENAKEYNEWLDISNHKWEEITQEEYDLLKEVLL